MASDYLKSFSKNLMDLIDGQMRQQLDQQLEMTRYGIDFNQQLRTRIDAQMGQAEKDYRVFQFQHMGQETISPHAHPHDLVTPRKLVQRGVKELPGYDCVYGPDTFAACLGFVNDNPGKTSTKCKDEQQEQEGAASSEAHSPY